MRKRIPNYEVDPIPTLTLPLEGEGMFGVKREA